jgi:hypothetical protein
LVVVRLPEVVRRVEPGVVGLAPAGRVASSVVLGTVVAPGVAPTGVVIMPPGVVIVPAGVVMAPPGVVIVPVGSVPMGTVPLVVPTWPGATVPGAIGVVAPGATGTVWAEALVARPSPSREAKANPKVFICEIKISKGRRTP